MKILAFMLVFIPVILSAQFKKMPLSVTLYNNSTMMPGDGDLFFSSSKIHPGFSIGTEYRLNASDKNMLIQTIKLGYFYHRLSEHGIQVYSEFAYRRLFGGGFYLSPLIGGGYLHAIPDMEVFVIHENEGLVKKKNYGRAQALASASIETGYQFKQIPLAFFLTSQFWLQMPFVKSYVPVLPNTSLHIGVRYNIYKRGGDENE